MKLISILFGGVLLCLVPTVFAQWQWLDKDGHKVFSDRAPPPDIAEKNILKRPAGRSPQAQPQSTEPADTPVATGSALPANVAKPTAGLDKELEAKKKALAAVEEAKKKTEDEKLAKVKGENCTRAKTAKVTFDSGVRISRTNANGEREIIDDATRNEEIKRIQGIIDRDCK